MPLFILGFLVLIGLLVIAIFNYLRGEPGDQSSPMRRARNKTEADDNQKEDEPPSGNVLYFPVDNVENEKRKRNL